MQCPANSFLYNVTRCACNPGYFYNFSRSCLLFLQPLELSSGVYHDNSDLGIPGTVFTFNTITKFTQSQAVFLEATLLMLASWLGFCFLLRFIPLDSAGRSLWFKIRWWIRHLDISFSKRHWLHDNKPVVKLKTELGGAFSIASWILFTGLFSALLFQIFSNRNVEVHNVRATNAPDLASFSNDLEFNITTISSMSCAQLRGLGTLVMGNTILSDLRVVPLATFANYSCVNTTAGPTIRLQCNDCRLVRDLAYISWQFVDLPNNPAAAVGFVFNLTAKNHARNKRLSFVSGTLQNASDFDDEPVTFRGIVPNILQFNLFPRLYRNLDNLRLIQPMFSEFLRGSYFAEVTQLRASLENASDGLINTTLCVNFLSSYIVEIDNQNIMGPVTFLADVGGLYCICIGIFLFFLIQCESRIKRIRSEDCRMVKIKNSRKAQDRWDKLRKYVRYTWGSSSLDEYKIETNEVCCAGTMSRPFHRSGSSRTRRALEQLDAITFSMDRSYPGEKNKAMAKDVNTQEEVIPNEAAMSATGTSSSKNYKSEDVVHGEIELRRCEDSNEGSPGTDIATLPPFPSLEYKNRDEISMREVKENLQKLYEYNLMLREKLIESSR